MIERFGGWIITAPLWAVAAVIFGGMILAGAIGLWLRRSHDARAAGHPDKDDKDDSQGVLVSAVMGLLALLIGFTFSLAINRYDTRRENVLLEANAIGTAYLRTQLLEEPYRTRLSRTLTDYTDARVLAAQEDPGPRLNALMRESDRLSVELWAGTVAAFPSIRSATLSHSYLEAMNALIDVDTIRKTGRRSHIPSVVFLALFLYLFVTTGVIAFVRAGQGSPLTTLLLFILFGVAQLLVVDIDRPTSGGVTESQQAMLDVQAFLKAQPPGSFDPPNAPAEAPPK